MLLFLWQAPLLLTLLICQQSFIVEGNIFQDGSAADKQAFLSTLSSEDEEKAQEILNANPFFNGCLTNQRVCNSDDPPFASQAGLCRQADPHLDYLEIRINSGNWDSVVSLTWLLQIILSEILGIPTTVHGGRSSDQTEERRSFYEPTNALDYNLHSNRTAIMQASNLPGCDCRNSNNEPCAHILPEAWNDIWASATTRQAIMDGKLEPPMGTGVLGKESWMVTKFSAVRDPTLTSYLGYMGEANRKKLAETFLRPTSWKQYCEEVSPSYCSEPDDVAERPPQNDTEEELMYFSPNLFTGHFRFTDQNNCTKNPTTCTGAAVNYPCDWFSGMESSIYHLNMALDVNAPFGYGSNKRQLEIWDAANATKSNLLMFFWTPHQMYSRYLDTDAEMQQVLLKPPTNVCVESKIQDECSSNITDRVGPPESACDNSARPLQKIVTGCLATTTQASDIPDALRNPAYSVLRQFQVNDEQILDILQYWQRGVDNPRNAICQWAKDNIEFLESFVPPTYPRVTEEESYTAGGYVLLAFGILAALLVILTAIRIQQMRDKPAIRFAQPHFLFLPLVGLFMVAVGSIMTSAPVSNATCVSSIWFVYMGYTLALAPTCIKVAAINQILRAASKMQRTKIRRERLFVMVALVSLVTAGYLALWTAFDPPQEKGYYTLASSTKRNGNGVEEHVVNVQLYCSGESDTWRFVAVGWNAVLLLCASVLAYQNRNTVEAFNESRTLAILIYSMFVFVILRFATYVFAEQINGALLDQIRSVLYILDTIAALLIYFVPKIFHLGDDDHHDYEKGNSHYSSHYEEGKSPLPSRMSFRSTASGAVHISGLEPPKRNTSQFHHSTSEDDANSSIWENAETSQPLSMSNSVEEDPDPAIGSSLSPTNNYAGQMSTVIEVSTENIALSSSELTQAVTASAESVNIQPTIDEEPSAGSLNREEAVFYSENSTEEGKSPLERAGNFVKQEELSSETKPTVDLYTSLPSERRETEQRSSQ